MATPLRFTLTFLVVFALLTGAFEATRGSAFERFTVVDLIIVPAASTLNAITPSDPVRLRGRTLVSSSARLHVTRGCEGVELCLLLAAAILAFRASIRRKACGLLVGSLIAYALSIARLVVLDYTLRDAPRTWEAMHGLIMPLLPVLLLAWYFARWSALATAPQPRGR